MNKFKNISYDELKSKVPLLLFFIKILQHGEVEIDKFVIKIEELVVEFKKDLTSKLAQSSELLFTELIRNKTLLEQTQSFLLLLFVAVEGLVTLEQIESDNNSEDIMIRRMI